MGYDIEVSHLSLRYDENYALKDVSFQLKEGKIYGLFGRNGAGKTSLLSLLASYREPIEGTIKIGGEFPFENQAVMQNVIFIYDKDDSNNTDTVKSLLEFQERYRPDYDREYADYLLKRFDLPLEKQIKELSRGKKSALRATIGLASRAKVTIFDETYLGMDSPTREIFYEELLKDHERVPRTMILSTHLIAEMDYLFEEILILDKGKLLYHEDYDSFVSRGVSITGPADQVDRFVKGMNVLTEKQLGPTKQVMVYEKWSEKLEREALQQDLEIGAISLQDLFHYLTEEGAKKDE